MTIIAGTDAGFLTRSISGHRPAPGVAVVREGGLSAPQALSAATRSGPAWFGQMDRYGGVAQGKAADLVLLTANPLQDIAATEKIDSVVLRGNVYDRAALDKMLADTRPRSRRGMPRLPRRMIDRVRSLPAGKRSDPVARTESTHGVELPVSSGDPRHAWMM